MRRGTQAKDEIEWFGSHFGTGGLAHGPTLVHPFCLIRTIRKRRTTFFFLDRKCPVPTSRSCKRSKGIPATYSCDLQARAKIEAKRKAVGREWYLTAFYCRFSKEKPQDLNQSHQNSSCVRPISLNSHTQHQLIPGTCHPFLKNK